MKRLMRGSIVRGTILGAVPALLLSFLSSGYAEKVIDLSETGIELHHIYEELGMKRAGLEERLTGMEDPAGIRNLERQMEVLDLGIGMADALRCEDEVAAGDLGRCILLTAIDARLSEIEAHLEGAGDKFRKVPYLERELLELDREYIKAGLAGDPDRAEDILLQIQDMGL